MNITRDAFIVDSLQTVLSSLNIPMGWQQDAKTNCWIIPTTAGTWTSKFFGILISGFALSMGSVFWFDLLNKLVNLRGSAKPAVATASEKGDEKDKN